MAGCSLFTSDENDPSNPAQNPDTVFDVATYNLGAMISDTSLFDPPVAAGTLDDGFNDGPFDREIDEASGLASLSYPKGTSEHKLYFWTHNDSGDEAHIFLLDSLGAGVASWVLEGAENRDWEDMAAGPGPQQDVRYLYVADIGDNLGRYDVKSIYRFPMPQVNEITIGAGTASTQVQAGTPSTQTIPAEQVEQIAFRYPGGVSMDAEALFVDPKTGDIYIVTKREEPVVVYKLAYPQSLDEILVADKVATLPMKTVTGGDISADGRMIILKTYDRVYLWARELAEGGAAEGGSAEGGATEGGATGELESVTSALMRPPVRVPYVPEPQGEAIAFLGNGIGFVTISEKREGVNPVLYIYRARE